MQLRLFILIGLLIAVNASAAYQTLEIIQPKGSGTGTPAIPSNHRVFYAYQGIEYKIRVAAIGGDYPYTFSLSNAPTGMTVDDYGYIRWENPQSSASNITVRVTDSNSAYEEETWSITVQTSGFKFVDCTEASNGTGTLASPYNSISNMTSGAASTDFIYFRAGTCEVPARGSYTINNAEAFQFGLPSLTANRWLAYPGEEPVIDLINDRFFEGNLSGQSYYFDGLTFYRGREYFFRTGSAENYVTFLDCTFDTLTLERTAYNSNQGTYFTSDYGTGYYLVFQGNTFTNFTGTQGIGSLYDQENTLVENNQFSNFDGADSTNSVLAFKLKIVDLTLRGNSVVLSSGSDFSIFGSSLNAFFGEIDSTPSENIEILYNYFRSDGTSGTSLNSTDDQGTTWMYRNTFDVPLTIRYLSEGDCNGPWYWDNNAWENADSGPSDHGGNTVSWTTCTSSYSDNIGATSGVVDENGLLEAAYSSSVGSAGWQFSDGSTPLSSVTTTTPNIKGITISGATIQ